MLLKDNVTQLEAAFTRLDEVLALVDLRFEPSKTELVHFAPKVQDVHCGHKPIHFSSLFPACLPSLFAPISPALYLLSSDLSRNGIISVSILILFFLFPLMVLVILIKL